MENNIGILIANDDVSINEAIVTIAKKYSNNIYAAFDGVAALDTFKEKDIGIIITDIGMPRLNGVGLIKNIAKVGKPRPYIITLSSGNTLDRDAYLYGSDIVLHIFDMKIISLCILRAIYWKTGELIITKEKG